MKTIIMNKDSTSSDIFPDDKILNITNQRTIVGLPVEHILENVSSLNSIIVSNVTPPDDWDALKYKYVEGEWISNSGYVEPYTLEVRPDSSSE